MVVIDITRDDFESLRKESERVNTQLQARAGWKGRSVAFEFDSPGAYYMNVEPSSVTVMGVSGQVGRMDYADGRMSVSGVLFDGCGGSQDVARRLRETCLSEENVRNLRRNTCGCCEVIPFITRTGFHDPKDVEVIAFFPEERYDIRSALIHSGLSFSERPVSEYREFCERNLERLSDTGMERHLQNDFARCSVLFDGKTFHNLSRARHLFGELGKGVRNPAVDVIRQVEVFAREVKYSLQSSVAAVDLPAVLFARASYPLVGDGSVFLVQEGKPGFGVYMNTEGRISVCDGQGWNDYPRQASRSDHYLEGLLNSPEAGKGREGLAVVKDFLRDQCLSVENKEKAGLDIDQWQAREESRSMRVKH